MVQIYMKQSCMQLVCCKQYVKFQFCIDIEFDFIAPKPVTQLLIYEIDGSQHSFFQGMWRTIRKTESKKNVDFQKKGFF